ncbi:MAG: hypothetical protein DHS20C18_37450 [Saprospiraceae bacterium]|nr:MAG: hypothetical protein DHS20C18_37450 [Saprospiraceae bacterium]
MTQLRSRLKSGGALLPLIQVFLAPILLLAIVSLVSIYKGISVGNFTRDPAFIADLNPFFGFISNVGVLCWCAAVVVCLLGGQVLYKHKNGQRLALFFLYFGLFTCLLMLDDLFLFHEVVFPGYLFIGEKITIAGYGILLIGGLFYFKDVVMATDFTFLILAIVMFGTSVFIDILQDPIEAIVGPWRILLEDGFKFLGIFAWLAYFWKNVQFEIEKIMNTQ